MHMPGFTASAVFSSGFENLTGQCVWRRVCVPLIACEGNACWVVRWICTYTVTCYG
jgi:hypothetical protein